LEYAGRLSLWILFTIKYKINKTCAYMCCCIITAKMYWTLVLNSPSFYKPIIVFPVRTTPCCSTVHALDQCLPEGLDHGTLLVMENTEEIKKKATKRKKREVVYELYLNW
jgi:hypothetical protein